MNIEEEIDCAARFGQQMEDLVYNEAEDGKVIYRTEDDYLLIAYWSLILDYSTGHRLPFEAQVPLSGFHEKPCYDKGSQPCRLTVFSSLLFLCRLPDANFKNHLVSLEPTAVACIG